MGLFTCLACFQGQGEKRNFQSQNFTIYAFKYCVSQHFRLVSDQGKNTVEGLQKVILNNNYNKLNNTIWVNVL